MEKSPKVHVFKYFRFTVSFFLCSNNMKPLHWSKNFYFARVIFPFQHFPTFFTGHFYPTDTHAKLVENGRVQRKFHVKSQVASL